MLTARHSHLEGHLQDAFNFRTRIDIGVVGHIVVLMLLTEIHTSGEFTDNHEVGSAQQLFLQRRLMQQAIEGGNWAHIGIESQLLAHSQQSRLGPHLCRRVVIVLQIAHGSKEHGIGSHAGLMGSFGIRVTNSLDGMGTTDGLFVSKMMAALCSNGIEHGNALLHDLRAYTVARKDGNS